MMRDILESMKENFGTLRQGHLDMHANSKKALMELEEMAEDDDITKTQAINDMKKFFEESQRIERKSMKQTSTIIDRINEALDEFE